MKLEIEARPPSAPFRLIVPNWYGVASVKWLKRIEVLTAPFDGEFQGGHYMYEWPDRPHEPVTLTRVRARITDPAPAAVLLLASYTVRGKGWSGSGGRHARSRQYDGRRRVARRPSRAAEGPYVWQGWAYDWTPIAAGRHTLRARATDVAGNVQPDVPPWNRLGYGNNAVEVRYVDVR